MSAVIDVGCCCFDLGNNNCLLEIVDIFVFNNQFTCYGFFMEFLESDNNGSLNLGCVESKDNVDLTGLRYGLTIFIENFRNIEFGAAGNLVTVFIQECAANVLILQYTGHSIMTGH